MTTPPNPSRPKPRRRPLPLDGRGHGRGTAADPASNTRTPKISIAQLASKTPGIPVATQSSHVYGEGPKYGYFRTKRDANKAIDVLLKSGLDWAQGVEYFSDKRGVVQAIFDRLFEAGS